MVFHVDNNFPAPGTSRLPVLHVGDPVFLQNPISKRWDTSGIVEAINPSTLSYVVRRGDGSIASRGRCLLRPNKATAPPDSSIIPANTPPARGISPPVPIPEVPSPEAANTADNDGDPPARAQSPVTPVAPRYVEADGTDARLHG